MYQSFEVYMENLCVNFSIICINYLFSKLADVHEYNTRNASTQHVYVCFQGTTQGQKTLSYCDARIWNYIPDNVDSKCAIGSFKKRIQRLFLFSNDDLIT